MDLKFLTENPVLKTMLLSKLKKLWRSNGIRLITIIEKSGELEFEMYNEDMIVISRKKFTEIINTENEKSI